MKFADIPGHTAEKAHLRSLVDNGRVPHALLLEGPAGTGKYMLARALAQYIHCTDRTADGDSCGKCPSCLQHQSINHIDTFYSFPYLKPGSGTYLCSDLMPQFRQLLSESPYMDGERWLDLLDKPNGQPQIYVDEAQALISRLSLTARQSQYKIVLMWLPEKLHESAANKLLKLIEEPSDDTIFILTSDNPQEILPTIYSRTQRVGVKAYSDAEVAEILQRNGIDALMASEVASLAEGNANRAFAATEAGRDSDKFLELFKELMRKAYMRNVGDLRRWSENVNDLKREGAIRFYHFCARMVRENFILNIGEPSLNAMSPAEQDFSRRFSPYINVVNVQQIFNCLTDARNDTMMNGNGKIIAFDLAVKMILLIKRGVEQR